MRKFRKVNNQGNSPLKESCLTISETTPDMTLTVREIMKMYVNNTLGDIAHELDYNEDDDDLRGLDPADVYYMAQEANKTILEQQERKTRKKKLDEKEKLKFEILAEIESQKQQE